MAKIAVKFESSASRPPVARALAQGAGWTVADVVCTAGPRDRPFEEQHTGVSIALVVAGTFQYRSTAGRGLMTPGSLLLGNPGQTFECGHEHDTGDRCVAFSFTPEYFERLAADAGAGSARSGFRIPRLPPLRGLSRIAAQACAGLAGSEQISWEELSVELAARTVQLARGLAPAAGPDASAVARVSRAVRFMEEEPEACLTLRDLARETRLSPYYFLRTFRTVTGVTPHQYLRRLRLRRAATRLSTEPARILDIALDSGFEDISTFNRAFRVEFSLSPRAYRRLHVAHSAPHVGFPGLG